MAPLTSKSVLKSASGMNMPVIGLGTWQSTAEDVKAAVHKALEAGYRLIDTALAYGNEAAIGEVLSEWLKTGKLKREELFVTTKIPYHDLTLVRGLLEGQLKALQLEYVDLYLIHNAVGFKLNKEYKRGDPIELDFSTDHVALWKEMEKLVDAGMTKYIGLSNFNVSQIQRVMKNARILPVNLQIELHVYCQSKELQEFCKKNGITVTSYSSFGSPDAKINFDIFSGNDKEPLKDPVVERIAKSHHRTPAQVLLRHLLQCGIAVIPKSVNPHRIQENIKLFDFELTKTEVQELNALDMGEDGRRLAIEAFKAHPEYPFRK